MPGNLHYSGVNFCKLVNSLPLSLSPCGLSGTYQSLDSLEYLKPLFFRRLYKFYLSLAVGR
jgi:hypothetical protein